MSWYMSVKKTSFQTPKAVISPALRKPVTTKTGGEKPTPVVEQKESFEPSDVSAATAADKPSVETKVEPENEPEKKKELLKPRDGSPMALMMENIEAAKLAGGEIKANSNGTLSVLEEAPSNTLESPGVEDKHHGGHGSHLANDSLLGGHLKTEVFEKVGHNAHHALEHGSSHGADLAHATGEVAEHGSDIAHEALDHAAEAVQEASTHGAEAASHASSDLGGVAKEGADAAHHLSTGLTAALGVSAGLSFGIGVAALWRGGKELLHGLKEKAFDKITEGVGGVALGVRSVAAAPVMASMVSHAPAVAEVAGVASKFLTPAGLIHGGADVVLGLKDLKDGKVTDGVLKTALGGTIMAGAWFGGLPLTCLALGVLGVKVGRDFRLASKAKKAAKALEAQQSQPEPQASPDAKDTKT